MLQTKERAVSWQPVASLVCGRSAEVDPEQGRRKGKYQGERKGKLPPEANPEKHVDVQASTRG